MNAITIGLDMAKSVFQVHGEDASGKVVFQKRLRRTQVEPLFAKLAPAVRHRAAKARRNAWNPARVTPRGQRSSNRANKPDT